MCAICKDWELGKLTNDEAINNLMEIIVLTKDNGDEVDEHYMEILEQVVDKEIKQGK